jgi:hypothetical protein
MGGRLFMLSAAVMLLSLAIGLFSTYLIYTLEPAALPEEEIKELAKQYFSLSVATEEGKEGKVADDDYVDQPMAGKVVIVTGATSGIGASFAYNMYKVGGIFLCMICVVVSLLTIVCACVFFLLRWVPPWS